MSMFKGQGANQALHDGPLLAAWLDSGVSSLKNVKNDKNQKINKCEKNGNDHAFAKKDNLKLKNELNDSNIYTRLRCFEREMVARTSSKVLGSRQVNACKYVLC
jgi:hypothetical protein